MLQLQTCNRTLEVLLPWASDKHSKKHKKLKNLWNVIQSDPDLPGSSAKRVLSGISGSNTVNFLFWGKIILAVNRVSGKSGPGKSGSDCIMLLFTYPCSGLCGLRPKEYLDPFFNHCITLIQSVIRFEVIKIDIPEMIWFDLKKVNTNLHNLSKNKQTIHKSRDNNYTIDS